MRIMYPTDTECYINYWLLRIWGYRFEIRNGAAFDAFQRQQIADILAELPIVTFNGRHYDVPMIDAAISWGANTEQLKQINDSIIVGGLKPWQVAGRTEWEPADHVDLIEVAPGVRISQKKYAGRIHAPIMRELPFHHSTVLSGPQMEVVNDYCGNDVAVLALLAQALAPRVEIRERMTDKFGFDVRSLSDAQVAEQFIKRECEKLSGRRIYKPEPDWNMQFKYDPPAFISFQTPGLQQLLREVCTSTFTLGATGKLECAALKGRGVAVGGVDFTFGLGGLHSKESSRTYRATSTHSLHDFDVAAFYPTLISNSSAQPAALGAHFQPVFRGLVAERLHHKEQAKRDDLPDDVLTEHATGNAVGKIMINGTFGKLGSAFSVLFAPKMMIQTTITGQLTLLMLIELFTLYGIRIVSANTDGVVIYCPVELVDTARQVVKYLEGLAEFEMEETQYTALYSRDVNNYVAVKTDGKVKRKGIYAISGIEKDPDSEVCADAVVNFLTKGANIVDHIMQCDDVRKFVTIRQVNGSAVKLWGEVPNPDALMPEKEARLRAHGWVKVARSLWQHPQIFEPLKSQEAYEATFTPPRREEIGKVIRCYYSTQAVGPIVTADKGHRVGDSEGMRPAMVLPEAMPPDVDRARYVAKAFTMLSELGF